MQPIFIFSVPRSGSTLVQRIIAAHEGVATVSEPWLVLPYAYTLRRSGVNAEYQHPLMVDAIADFCGELPAREEDYRRALRECILGLYQQAADDGAHYFLDKSPPYCLVSQEIMGLFPEAKFIFLWRNPLSVVASIIETWEPWRPTLFREDLFIGLPRLVSAYKAAKPPVHSVRFEDLVGGDEQHWSALMGYLEMRFDPDTLHRFADVKLGGRMGDPTGAKRYSSLSSEPQQKWKETLANPLRREWCRRYLAFLGSERLARMGYDHEQLRHDLDSQPVAVRSLLPDLRRMAEDVTKELIRVRTRSPTMGGPNVIRELLRH